MQDGSTEIYCFLRGASFRGDSDEFAEDILKEYYTVDGNKITISKDILDLAYNKNDFHIEIIIKNGDSYTYYWDLDWNYYEFESLFLLGGKK